MADVFISYSREDRAHAERLARQIEALGLSVWWDRETPPADDEAIERELDAAAAVLVLWTPHSVDDETVREEAHEARAQNKAAPILMGDCRPPRFFRRHQYEDFTDWSGRPEAVCFQRLAIQLAAFARGQEAADRLPLDGVEAPRLDPSAPRPPEERGALGRWISFAAMAAALIGAAAYVKGFEVVDAIGPFYATLLVLAASAIALFRAAEGALPAGPKALVARWLAGEQGFSSSQAFLTMFEAVFTKRHWTWGCFWRSMTATIVVYLILLALFVDFPRLMQQASAAGAFLPDIAGDGYQLKEKLEKSALLLLVIVPLTNIFADFVSLWQTRKVLQLSANRRLPLWLGVILDAALTAAVFILLLPLGPMLAIFATDGPVTNGAAAYSAFSPKAWEAAVGFVPEVWRGFWMIFEGHPIAEIDTVLASEASLSTTTLLIAFVTTFITSVWLWLALLAAPIFWLLGLGRQRGGVWLARATGATRRPIQTLGYGAAAAVLTLGAGGAAVASALLPDQSPKPFRDCDACPWMVDIPAGVFEMGSPEDEAQRNAREGPQRPVEIAPFAIGIYEVTFREWKACARDGFCQSNPKPEDAAWGRGLRPAIYVSWDDIRGPRGFLDWLNARPEVKAEGVVYRLPSEAEWEYAARAGTTTRFWVGDQLSHIDANFAASGKTAIDGAVVDFAGRARGQTLPVGAFPPNAFGLHDVHGNVWEWVEDCYDFDGYEGKPADATPWRGECSGRYPRRGGSWLSVEQDLRSAERQSDTRTKRSNKLGFRVARSPAP